MHEFEILSVFIIFSIFLSISMIMLSVLAAPKSTNDNAGRIYECGLNINNSSRIKFQIQFFVYAVLFLVFDIETIFIFPFAVSFSFLGLYVVGEILFFIILLLLGLIYAARTRMLRFK